MGDIKNSILASTIRHYLTGALTGFLGFQAAKHGITVPEGVTAEISNWAIAFGSMALGGVSALVGGLIRAKIGK